MPNTVRSAQGERTEAPKKTRARAYAERDRRASYFDNRGEEVTLCVTAH